MLRVERWRRYNMYWLSSYRGVVGRGVVAGQNSRRVGHSLINIQIYSVEVGSKRGCMYFRRQKVRGFYAFPRCLPSSGCYRKVAYPPSRTQIFPYNRSYVHIFIVYCVLIYGVKLGLGGHVSAKVGVLKLSNLTINNLLINKYECPGAELEQSVYRQCYELDGPGFEFRLW